VELNILNMYRELLLPLTPSKEVADVLSVVMQGGETTQDIANLIARDAELKDWIDITVQRSGRGVRAGSSLEYKVSLLGLNRVRDMIVGRNIERALIPEDKTILALMLEERNKAKAKNKAGSPMRKSEEEAQAEEEQRIIPDLVAFNKYTAYAMRAEAASIEVKNSYPGQAYAGGVLFDYINSYFSQSNIENLVQEQRFKKPQKFIEELFDDGLRCALVADEITKYIQIPYQRNVFFTSLVRNIGKALLLAYDPQGYERSIKAHRDAKLSGLALRSSEAEEDEFDMDHAQVAALYVGRVPCFAGLEKSIDYHHNPRLLKSRDRELHALSCVLRVAGLLSALYQEHRSKQPEINKIPDRGIVESEVFQFLRLTPDEWEKIKLNYSMNLMKLSL
jgi:HD-like signal output (HDOD) protein